MSSMPIYDKVEPEAPSSHYAAAEPLPNEDLPIYDVVAPETQYANVDDEFIA